MEKDNELVAAARHGDLGAFEKLVKQYERPVYNLALRMLGNREDARDVSQTVFLKVYENLDGFDPGQRFFSWVYRIAVNAAIDFRKSGSAAEVRLDTLGEDIQDPEQPRQHDLQRNLQEALMKIAPEQRSVVLMKHLLGFSYQDICEVLALPEATVKSRLYEARSRLKTLIKREDYL